MMKQAALDVELRDANGKSGARALRRQGLIPGVLYGNGPSVAVSLSLAAVTGRINAGPFVSRIVEIRHKGKKQPVIAQDLQFHPLTGQPIHIDLFRIASGARVRVEVSVRFVGQDESPGLKRGGSLNVVRRSVEIEAMPDAVPGELVADLTGLEIGDNVKISAIDMPDGAEPTITDRDFTIATITGRIATPSDEEEQQPDQDESEEADTDES